MAVQSSHDLHSIGQGFAGKRIPGHRWEPARLNGGSLPAEICPRCAGQITVDICKTQSDGRTYWTTYRKCPGSQARRYGKEPTCQAQVEKVEIHNEMANPTGKRPALDRTPDKADQAEWQRLKAALKLSNKHLIEASGVRSIALYDWFADRLVTQETENRIKDGLKLLRERECEQAGLLVTLRPKKQPKESGDTDRVDSFLFALDAAKPAEPADIWSEARQFAEAASKMARLNVPLFQLICEQALEQVAK